MRSFLPVVTIVLIVLVSCTSNSVDSVSLATTNTVSVASLSVDGPHEIRSILSPEAAEFSGATIYFPIDADTAVGGVVISPGFAHSQRNINWWGPGWPPMALPY